LTRLHRPSFRSRTTLALAIAAIVSNAFVVAITWRTVQGERHRETQAAERTTNNLARVLEEALDASMKQIDLALLSTKEEVERQLAGGGVRGAELEAYIGRLHSRLSHVDALRFADPTGRVRHGIDVPPGSNVNVGDRDYYVRARDYADAGMAISAPLVGRISGKWSIIFARRANWPDGSFGGVVYAIVTLEQFTRTLARIDVGSDGAVVLRGANMEMIARYPPRPEIGRSVGEKAASKRLLDAVAAGITESTYIAHSPFDGVERVISYRRVDAYPLHLIVALSLQDYLAEWRKNSMLAWMLAALFAVISVVSSVLMVRYWRKEREAGIQRQVEESQKQLIGELRTALAEVKTLSGLLPICSHCKMIRDDRGYWNRIESYIRERSDAEFTHGICPDCAERYFPPGR
jgi:hypothetical protein